MCLRSLEALSIFFMSVSKQTSAPTRNTYEHVPSRIFIVTKMRCLRKSVTNHSFSSKAFSSTSVEVSPAYLSASIPELFSKEIINRNK